MFRVGRNFAHVLFESQKKKPFEWDAACFSHAKSKETKVLQGEKLFGIQGTKILRYTYAMPRANTGYEMLLACGPQQRIHSTPPLVPQVPT